MIILLAQFVPLRDATDLELLQRDPGGSYIIASPSITTETEYQFRDFRGVILGNYNELTFRQSTPVFDSPSGVLLRVKLVLYLINPAAESALVQNASCRIQHSFLTVECRNATSSSSSESYYMYVMTGADADVGNVEMRIVVDSKLPALVLGYAQLGVSADLTNVSLHAQFDECHTFAGIRARDIAFANVSAVVNGTAATELYGIGEVFSTCTVRNVSVNIGFLIAEHVYALFESAKLTQVSNLNVSVKGGSCLTAALIGAVHGEELDVNNVVLEYVLNFGGSHDEVLMFAGVALQQATLVLANATIKATISTQADLDCAGVQVRSINERAAVRSAIIQMDVAATSFDQNLRVGGVVVECDAGNVSNVLVQLECHISANETVIGGVFAVQNMAFAVDHVHTRVTVQQERGENSHVGGVVGDVSSIAQPSTAAYIFCYATYEQDSQLRETRVGGFAGRCGFVELTVGLLRLQAVVRSDHADVAGFSAHARGGFARQLAIVLDANSLYDRIGTSRLAGVAALIAEGFLLQNSVVNASLHSVARLKCYSIGTVENRSAIELETVFSVGSVMQCGRDGWVVDGAAAVWDYYELRAPDTKFLQLAVKVNYLTQEEMSAKKAELDGNFTSVDGVFYPWLAGVPFFITDTYVAHSTLFGDDFVQVCRRGSEYCQVVPPSLPNQISDAIGEMQNPFGQCTAGSCTSDCSGHGQFADTLCVCQDAYTGPQCEFLRCNFADSVFVAGNASHCGCEAGFVYVAQTLAPFAESCEPRCSGPVCERNPLCYRVHGGHACVHCERDYAGEKCENCADPAKVLDDNWVCRTRVAGTAQRCWYANESCVSAGCDFECTDHITESV